MLINVGNEKAKRQAQRAFLRRQQSIVRPFARKLQTVLHEQYNAIASMLEQQRTDMGLDVVLDRWGIELYRAYSSGYRQTASSFSQLIFDAINNLKLTSPPESKAMQDEFWQAFTQFSHSTMAKRVVGVNNATKKFIRRTIDRGVKDGKSYGKIAKDLRDRKQNKFNKKRALRIARTEVHTISNYSTQEAVKSTRLEMEKEWVAFIDDRTRTDHIMVNGKRAAMNADFNVGGAAMSFPGDPKGGAKNVINCRCVVMYHKVKSVVGGTTQRPTTGTHRPTAKPKPKPTKNYITQAEAQKYYEKDIVPDKYYTHGRGGHRQNLKESEYVIQCSRSWDFARQYAGKEGEIYLITPLKKSSFLDLSNTNTKDTKKLVNAALQSRKNEDASMKIILDNMEGALGHVPNKEEFIENIVKEFSPTDIVNSAQAYDNEDWINWLTEDSGLYPDGTIVPNGLAVFDASKTKYYKIKP